MNDIEQQVREMLERRSQDIDPSSTDGRSPISAASPRSVAQDLPVVRRSLTLPIGIAAVMLLLATGFVAVSRRDGPVSTSAAGGQRIATTPDVDESTSTSTIDPSVDHAEGDGSVGSGSGVATIEDFVATFPDAVDPMFGPMIYADYGEASAEGQLVSYMAKRMPDLQYSAETVDVDGDLTLFRWSVSEADIQEAGLILVRGSNGAFSVVAAGTDGIDVARAIRTSDGIDVVITYSRTEELVADVTTLYGRPIASAPNPEGLGPPDVPVFGTAGFTESGRMNIELETGSEAVVVRAQNIGGTWLTIIEFAIDSVGFPEVCGSEPPLSIEVGSQLGGIEPGPAPQSTAEPLPNQQVWHYPGSETSIEIRWPADPAFSGRADPATIGDAKALSFKRAGTDPTGDHVLAILENPSTESPSTRSPAFDPCSMVQFSILGDPNTTDWWATALSGQRSFGLALSVAELDPTLGPLDMGEGDDPGSTDELVIGTDGVSEAPRLPATGSCDGLPNDPPRAGTGDQPAQSDPLAALAAWVSGPGQVLDPPVGTTGYTELQVDEENISYVYPSDSPVVVVNVQLGPDGWVVRTWEASPC